MTIRNAHLEPATTAQESTPIIELAKTMRDKKLRHVYIIDHKEFPVGIVSVTDINNKIVAEGKSPGNLHAKDVMTSPLHMIEIDNDVKKAYLEMVEHSTYAIPVVDNGLLVGVLSVGEALRLLRGR